MDIALARLVAQGLTSPLSSPTLAASHMLATQAQAPHAAAMAIALRSTHSLADVDAAYDHGEIVRSWPMRGTLHALTPLDLRLLLSLTRPRIRSTLARRRTNLSLDASTISHATSLVERALLASPTSSLSRSDVFALWTSAGLLTQPQQGYHLLLDLSVSGLLCLGPIRSGEQHFVLLDAWAPPSPLPSPEEALPSLLLRYLLSHGPATLRDFSWWSSLPLTPLRTALAEIRPSLSSLTKDGEEYFFDPTLPSRLAALPAPSALLPAFDETLLGYASASRSHFLPPEHAQKVLPGGGMFLPTVMEKNRLVGTWKIKGSGRSRRIDATPFASFSPALASSLPTLFSALPS